MSGSERLKQMLIQHGNENAQLPPWRFLKYITPADFKHPTKIHPVLLIYLDCLRWEATRLANRSLPVIVTDDYRADDTDSTHGAKPCLGADIRCKSSSDRYHLLHAAFNLGITRIGIYCDDLHLHFDIGDKIDPALWPTEVAWVRECGK